MRELATVLIPLVNYKVHAFIQISHNIIEQLCFSMFLHMLAYSYLYLVVKSINI